VLKPILEQFKQGRDTQDVQAAVHLLHSLADGLREETSPFPRRVRGAPLLQLSGSPYRAGEKSA